MTSEEPPRQSGPQRPSFDLNQINFDPTRVKLPVMAAIGFAVGVLFHACVVFAVLDSGAESSSTNATNGNDGIVVETLVTPTETATVSPTGDRTDCDAIRGTDYRSDEERQWFIDNC